MSEHIIEFDEKCKSCKGTGLHVGFAERNGAAVVCYICNGTGCHHVKIDYEDFEERIIVQHIERVFQTNPGICIGTGNGHQLKDFGGMLYLSWLAGNPFAPNMENRKFTCPAWWFQSADYEQKPTWKECMGYGSFSCCKYFPEKDKCWKRFDKQALAEASEEKGNG